VLGSCAMIDDAFRTMRIFLFLIVASLATGGLLRANEQLIKRFDGHNSLTTADFTVPNGWEVRWRSEQVLSVGVIRLDNTVIAGASGRNVGSLYLPEGGTYRIRVKGEDPIPWDVAVLAVGTSGPLATADDAGDYYSPTTGPAYQPGPPPATPPVQVVTPTPVVSPAPPAEPPPLPTQLTAGQLQAIVTIKGDRAQGAGFFMKTATGTTLVTVLQLISNNPNWQVTTSTGAVVKVTKIQGAMDRDVAMLGVKDFGYKTLDPGNPALLHPGDSVLTASGNGTPMPAGAVLNIGPRRLEIDRLRPVPGSPLVLASSGKVVGLVDVTPQMQATAGFADDDFDERDSSVTGSIAPFGQRVDNVPAWDTCDAAQLQLQALFLDNFHQRSRTLDAYLNGTGDERDAKLWKSDDKVKSANDTFVQDTAGGNPSERTEALHALLFELSVAADTDMDQIQQPANFYGFWRTRARDEIAYRQAIKAQIDAYGSDVTHFYSVASRNN
jgi:hypothetical protein